MPNGITRLGGILLTLSPWTCSRSTTLRDGYNILKLGTVNVTDLLRALQGNGHPSTLAKAIAELGRIAKTLYLVNYIDDPAYRRRILIQLNKKGKAAMAWHESPILGYDNDSYKIGPFGAMPVQRLASNLFMAIEFMAGVPK